MICYHASTVNVTYIIITFFIADNQSVNLGVPNHPTDNGMMASSSTGITEESNAVNEALENDDSVYRAGKILCT